MRSKLIIAVVLLLATGCASQPPPIGASVTQETIIAEVAEVQESSSSQSTKELPIDITLSLSRTTGIMSETVIKDKAGVEEIVDLMERCRPLADTESEIVKLKGTMMNVFIKEDSLSTLTVSVFCGVPQSMGRQVMVLLNMEGLHYDELAAYDRLLKIIEDSKQTKYFDKAEFLSKNTRKKSPEETAAHPSADLDCPCNIAEGEDIFAAGVHIDVSIVRYIGSEKFYNWIADTPNERHTIYKLVGDFDLSWTEIQNIVSKRVFTGYMENMPANPSAIPDDCCDLDINEMFELGTYVDCALIGHIGEENFETWVDSTPAGTRTVYKLVDDFDLSWEDLKSVVSERIYAEYMKNMPK